MSPEPAALARLEATIHGRVHGVGFRYYVWREAGSLDLAGWVANESDGTVRCVAEGPRDRLEALLTRLEEGPPASIVERVVTVALGEEVRDPVLGDGEVGVQDRRGGPRCIPNAGREQVEPLSNPKRADPPAAAAPTRRGRCSWCVARPA